MNRLIKLMDLLQTANRMNKIIPRPSLQFEVHLVEHCNLNCKGCDNFSPLAQKEFLDSDEYKKDIRRLSELCDGECGRIYLLGGEPLLHPQLDDFLRYTRKAFPYSKIYIFTNGLLIPRLTDATWKVMRVNDIAFMITPYPVGFDYEKCRKLAQAKGISFQYCMDPKKNKKLFHFTLDLSGSQDAVKSFMKCDRSNNCITLKHGRLYTCSLLPNIVHFNRKFKENQLHICEHDSIDIYKAKNLEEILIFLSRPVPFCRYCKTGMEREKIKWCRSSGDISEWT